MTPPGKVNPLMRRAFTIVEVVMVIVVLGIAVPPTLDILVGNAAQRADTINTARATMLASSVLEGVIADVTSGDETLGFDALEDESAYLSTPDTGFYDRMSATTDAYTSLGLSYSVQIGALVGADGLVSETESENIFRTVTVRVSYPSSSGSSYSLPVSVVVSDL